MPLWLLLLPVISALYPLRSRFSLVDNCKKPAVEVGWRLVLAVAVSLDWYLVASPSSGF